MLRYSDRSPLENHHLCEGFTLLKQHNFLKLLRPDQRVHLRKLVVELVGATDM